MAVTDHMANVLRRTFELQDPRHARLLPMEGLRGLAVTLVFFQHYTVQSQLIGLPPGAASSFAAVFSNYGNLGVELFFVLSGYLIYGTLVRKAPSFIHFIARRYQRIYPAFLTMFAFALALTVLVPIPGKIPDETWRAAAYLAANLALIPGIVPMVRIVDVAWSLSYEMFFYFATSALVLSIGVSRFHAKRRSAVLWVLTLAFIAASLFHIPNFPARMLPFFAGMLLAEGVGKRVPTWAGWLLPLGAFAAGAAGLLSGPLWEPFHTAAFFALCAVCFREDGVVSAAMAWTPLRWLGNMSYSYYLAHGFVVRITMVVLGKILHGAMPETLFWALIPVLYIVTLAVSALLFVSVEKPFSLRPTLSKAMDYSSGWAVAEAHHQEKGSATTGSADIVTPSTMLSNVTRSSC